MGTYVPQRVAKLSRAISRLQRRNAGGGRKEKRGWYGVEKETRKRKGEEERSDVKGIERERGSLPKREKSGKSGEGKGRQKGVRRNGAMESIRR